MQRGRSLQYGLRWRPIAGGSGSAHESCRYEASARKPSTRRPIPSATVAASSAPYEMRIEHGAASANADPGIAATRCSRMSRSASVIESSLVCARIR